MTVALTNTLLTAGIAALVAWRLHARIRRVVGRQRLSPLRPWLAVTLFPLLVVLVMPGSRADPRVARGSPRAWAQARWRAPRWACTARG